MTTKRQQIMALHARGKSTREIAVAVYGLPPNAPHDEADRSMAYVRVVTRQRKGGSASAADAAWLIKTYGGPTIKDARRRRSAENYSDPTKRKRHNRQCMASYRKRMAKQGASSRVGAV